jgi:hypothetical protein
MIAGEEADGDEEEDDDERTELDSEAFSQEAVGCTRGTKRGAASSSQTSREEDIEEEEEEERTSPSEGRMADPTDGRVHFDRAKPKC